MIQWYNVANLTDFEETGLVSQEIPVNLGDLGEKTVLITQGNTTGLTFEGVFLALNLNDKNPFQFNDYWAYLDEDDEIWLGVYVED